MTKEEIKEYKRKYYKENKERLAKLNKEWREENKDRVKELNKEYRESNKDKLKEYHKTWSADNKDKTTANREKYRSKEETKEKRKKYSKEYHINNQEERNNQTKEYYRNNKELVLAMNYNYRNKRRATDDLYKLTGNIRSLINKSVKRNGYTKRSRTHQILGCSYEEFKNHIESLWESWMSWDNYGLYNGTPEYGWDIDHKQPISSAINEESVIALNHYTNLQPLCSYINRDIKKHNLYH